MPVVGPGKVFLGGTAIGAAYLGSTQLWSAAPPSSGVIASGGTETVINPAEGEYYRVHTFLEDDELTVTQGGDVEYFMVAGGAAGGPGFGAGGGAGGVRKYVQGESDNTSGPLALGAGTHSAQVGSGGQGAQTTSLSAPFDEVPSESGGNTIFAGLTCLGGGGAGGRLSDQVGADGGSGGGGRANGFIGQALQPGIGGLGHNSGESFGTSTAAGGGGAGGAGAQAGIGNGGIGIGTAISGGVQRFAGGGGGMPDGVGVDGAGSASASPVLPATPGTGAGGGGSATANGAAGGNGASGIVIIRYPITEAEYNAEAA